MISQSVHTDKREQILNSALHLFVEFGFNGAPTSKIAQNAGVSNGTLFHYFKTKDELIVELYIRLKSELNSFIASKLKNDDDIKTRFRKMLTVSIEWALENTEKFYYIQQICFTPHISLVPESVLKEQMRMYTKLIGDAEAAKMLKKIPADLVAVLGASHFTGMHNYVKTLPACRRKAVIDKGFELFWETISEKV